MLAGIDGDFDDFEYNECALFDQQAHNSERQLWCGVIHQAILDYRNNSTTKDALNNKEMARRWLCGNGCDFRLVCSLAGISAKRIRQQINGPH